VRVEIVLGAVIISSVSPGLGRRRLRAVYAIIRTGGKQYRVAQGDTIYVERLEAPVGEKVTLGEVLFVGGEKGETKVGAPLIDKASVAATVLDLGRDHKIRVFKYKKRKHYRRTRGHRQSYTALRIDSISL
jgi:large subunit ribosomal protein L21